MKEVTGEANMTIVAIVLIGILAVAATAIINGMMDSIEGEANVDSIRNQTMENN